MRVAAGPSNPGGFQVRNVYNASNYLSQVVRQATGAVLWQANALDAYNHVLNESLGNGLVMARAYDDLGRNLQVSTGTGGTGGTVGSINAVHFHSVAYNNIDQVVQRLWANAGAQAYESLAYDDVNQLIAVSSSLGGAASKNLVYDTNGNILTKDGACTNGRGLANCQYNTTAGTHRLASITGTVAIPGLQAVVNPSFGYDANGNLTASAGVSVSWTAFNMPQTISRNTAGGGTKSDWFVYGPEHQRIKQIATLPNSGGTLTTWYLPGYEQELNSDTGATENKYYLSAGGRTFAIFVDKYTAAAPGGTPNDLRYLHQDQLGSVVAITNATAGVIELLSYDAFGKRRNPDGSDATVALIPQNDRGYTGHEMLDSVGLIHMNGRIYDPNLGRFLSADPFIQAAGLTLSYNRYAYVLNNPLVLTDPSGYSWLSKTWKKLWHNEVFRMGLSIAAGYFTGQFVGNWLFDAGFTASSGGTIFSEVITLSPGGGTIAGAAGGFAGGLVASGGDVKAGAQGALTGGLMGWAGGIGTSISPERYAAHALAGCIGGAVDGSGCGRGAASAVVGKFATNLSDGVHPAGQFAISVVAGGTASVITGGKFANGARTAAYGYLFNHCREVEGGCLQALKDAASMAYDWASGKGESMRVFGPESIQVTDMKDAPGVNAARAYYYAKYPTADPTGSVTNYGASFGLTGLFDADGLLISTSPTRQFVGSYRIDIFTVNNGSSLMFVLNNNSSLQSFLYGAGPAYERTTFAPAGNIRQVYWWIEPRKK